MWCLDDIGHLSSKLMECLLRKIRLMDVEDVYSKNLEIQCRNETISVL